jgi:hypothetical protein
VTYAAESVHQDLNNDSRSTIRGVCVVSHGITGAANHVGISGLKVPVGTVGTCRSSTAIYS